MKKLITIAAAVLAASMLFAASYKNNTYQKLADEYTAQAQSAFDAGQYDTAVELSKKAAENAELSEAYIKMMTVRGDADAQMKIAKNRITEAEQLGAERTFPMAYTAAKDAYANAEKSYAGEDFSAAYDYAKQAVAALEGVHKVTPLPEFYIVRPWAENRDCFWNISGRPFVYNNPRLWENLYDANKSNIPDSSNPNLIKPGMKMKIPSLSGEYREGVYSPSEKYETYGSK